MAGTLIVCAGPIGNLSDAPPRLAEALSTASIVYAEDTRRARTLLDHLGVKAAVRSYFAGNEERRSSEITERIAAGEVVALVTDAGTPGISDPGLTAVRAALEGGGTVTGVPGPSAVTLALAVAGEPADRFVFEGFLPRRGVDRKSRLAAVGKERRTVVLFSAPGRLGEDLADLAASHDRPRHCVVCREMTKLYEEVWRGSLGDAAAHWSAANVRGEVTIVLGPQDASEPDLEAAAERVAAMVGSGATRSDAVRRVAEETGVSRRALYNRVVG